jgi:uncharacterized RDD family membrane protein YckC
VYTAASIAFTAGHVAVSRANGGWFYLYRGGEIAVIVAYYVVNWMRSGQTLGMRAWRLMAVTDSGRRLTLGGSLLRFLCGIPAWLPAGLGVLWMYLDAEGLPLNDRLSHSRMVQLTRS